MERARQMVRAITAEPIVGDTYEGTVKSTTAFGAFIEIMPGTEALLHISEMRHGRVDKTEDVVKKGDRVKVKLIDRDERGRLRLSMKALEPKPEGGEDAGNGGRPPRGERSGGGEGTGGAEEGSGTEERAMAAEGSTGGESGGRGGERRPPRRGGGGGGRGGRPRE
jgi:polyribonucleotide nucleotidyltransferase